MITTPAVLRIGLLHAIVLAVGACGRGALPATTPPSLGMYALQVNGRTVQVPVVNTVWEALRRTASASLLGAVSSSGARPLYVIDGVETSDGLRALERMPVCDVEEIELLRPGQAVAAFGVKAGAGAIVLKTRRGDTPTRGC